MDELNVLLRAIISEPDNDVPRLAYADHLDGLDTVYTKCTACAGTGQTRFQVYQRDEWGSAEWATDRCPLCLGVNQVADLTNRTRAAFIRKQIELFRSPHCSKPVYEDLHTEWGGPNFVTDRVYWGPCGRCRCLNCHQRGSLGDTCEALYRQLNPLGNNRHATEVRAELNRTERGFLRHWFGTAEAFLTQIDQIIWHPDQTDPCSTCRGFGHFYKGNDDRNTCPEECEAYPSVGRPCDGTGRISRPCPPTAQPIRQVTLTTISSVPDESGIGIHTFPILEWFQKRWPGIQFNLPPDQEEQAATEDDDNPEWDSWPDEPDPADTVTHD